MHDIKRRHWLRTLAGSGVALTLARPAQQLLGATVSAAPASCRLTPEEEEGPFYIPNEALRSDLREGLPGVLLDLRLQIIDSTHCGPLSGCAVEIWSCDAKGRYAGFDDLMPPGGPHGPGGPGGPDGLGDHGGPDGYRPPPGGMGGQMPPGSGGASGFAGGPPGGGVGWPGQFPPKLKPTNHLTFLRGIQMADAQGAVRFLTLFPGCYEGRVNHVHLKVRRTRDAAVSHTGQIFFPESVSTRVMAMAPYTEHQIVRTTLSQDHVYTDQQGASTVARVQALRGNDLSSGVMASLTLVVDPNAVPPLLQPTLPQPGRPE